jgi:predicted O-methyltransferase YrrM
MSHTDETLWARVDSYLTSALHEPDPVLEAALAAAEEAGLPQIQVSPPLGKLLHLLARAVGARRILEVGALGGYSTIWLARALPETGRLISLEIEPRHAEVARRNLAAAGLDGIAEVRLGRAIDSLAALAREEPEPFDVVFIDADKPSNADYFAWAVDHTHPGSLVVVDNTVRGGTVADPTASDEATLGVRRLHELIASEPRVTATAIQTVGAKGYDGFTIALVG